MKQTILSILTIAAMAISTNAQIPTTGLVGHYDFTNGALTDNINSVDFTKTGTASTNITDRFGNANAAISLNGDDLVRPDIDFNVTNANPYLPRTISFWMKTATNDGNVRLIYNDNNRTNVGAFNYTGLIVYLQNGQVKTSNRVGANGNLVTHSVAVNDNEWHHVVIQGYSTSLSGTKSFFTYIFIDGVKEGGNGYQTSSGSVSVTANEYNGNLGFSRLANTSLSSNQKYEDGLDEVLFYTRILTDTEISSITSNGFCTVNIPDANFKAFLLNSNIGVNTNGDSEIQCSEASAFTGTLFCGYLGIADLTGIEAFTALTKLDLTSNNLTSIDVSQNTALTELICGENSLTTIDVSQNTVLTKLQCPYNQLTNLDLSNNTNLTTLNCNDNQLTALDISNNTSLITLYCEQNQLTTLDVSAHTNLDVLLCSNNNLTALDVSTNIALTNLACNDNQLTSLNTANGNNLNMTVEATSNPSLTCIQVDDVANANTNWDKDAGAIFSTSCGALGVSEIKKETVTIYPNPVQDNLTVDLENKQITKIEIIDFSGRIVKTIANNNIKSINVSDLTQGVYILKISTEGGVSTNRFIKK